MYRSNEQKQRLSVQELKFILSPNEHEIEENISFLLYQRLKYKDTLKTTKIRVKPLNWFRSVPSKSYKEDPEEIAKIKSEKRVTSEKIIFKDYLNYTRQLGMTFNDLFNREFFTTQSSDPEEQYRQLFVMSQRTWEF